MLKQPLQLFSQFFFFFFPHYCKNGEVNKENISPIAIDILPLLLEFLKK